MNRNDCFSVVLLIVMILSLVCIGIKNMELNNSITTLKDNVEILNVQISQLEYFNEHKSDSITINIYYEYPKKIKK